MKTLRLPPFLKVFLPLALAICAAFAFYGGARAERAVDELADRGELAVGMGASVLTGALDMVVGDLSALAGAPALRAALDSADQQAFARVAADWLSFSSGKRLYDQIRWLDERGVERLRVNYRDGRVRLAQAAELQDKGQRYYLREMLALPAGALYLSPLDLNIEDGRIEQPLRPMIRVGTVLADGRGAKRGLLLLNYRGQELLDRFKLAARAFDRVTLVDARGYWLRGASADDEWGFMLGRPERTLAQRAPAAWARIGEHAAGRALADDGLWIWRSVHPLPRSAEGAGPGDASYPWRVVAHQPPEALAAVRAGVWKGLAVPALLALLLAALGSWKLCAAWRGLARADEALREANRELRSRVEERTQALNLKVGALIESDMRYRTTFENAAVGIARVSPKGLFVEINPAFCALIGYSREQLLSQGFSFQRITHPDDLAEDEAQVARLLRGEAAHYAMEKRYIRKDGSEVWASLSVALVRDRDGEPRYFVSSVIDLSERKRLEAELLQMANSDFLTGLANRRHFMERLTDELARVQRGEPDEAAVLMLDLDLFKAVNDRHGHAVGDALLRHFSVVVGHELRRIDSIGRIGGEEFAIVLPAAGESASRAFAERLRERLAASPMSLGDAALAFTVSIGITTMTPADHCIDQVLARADRALYRAKQAGRNCVAYLPAVPD